MADNDEYIRENARLCAASLLNLLQEFFPTWNWLHTNGGLDTFMHFSHSNFATEEFAGQESVDSELLYRLVSNSLNFFSDLAIPDAKSVFRKDGPPHIWYRASQAEKLLVTYLDEVRRTLSNAEYKRIQSKVAAYFAL